MDYKVRSSRPSAGKFLANPNARDDVEPRPPCCFVTGSVFVLITVSHTVVMGSNITVFLAA